MSSKRSSSPGTSAGPNNSPNGKRPRPAPQRRRPFDQSSIDSFFKSSRTATNLPAESSNSKLPASPSKPRPSPTSISDRASPVIIDVDCVSDPDPEDIQEIPTTSSTPASHRVQAQGADLVRPTSVAFATTSITTTEQSIQYPNLSVDPAGFVLGTSFWPTSAPAPYSFLAHVLCALSATRSRIAILNILTNALRVISR